MNDLNNQAGIQEYKATDTDHISIPYRNPVYPFLFFSRQLSANSFLYIVYMVDFDKMDITRPPPPLMDILVKYIFELRRTCPNYWWKKVLPAYRHFKTR